MNRTSNPKNLQNEVCKHEIIPDIIASIPPYTVEVTYDAQPKKLHVELGNVLTPKQTLRPPSSVCYPAIKERFYTLMLLDPDFPTSFKPKYRSWQLWLVVNIQGSDLNSGHVITEYIGPCPARGSGTHRFVFLVFEQQQEISPSEYRVSKNNSLYRSKFEIEHFVDVYNLGEAQAINFFLAEYDEAVSAVMRQFTKVSIDPELEESPWTG